MKPDFYRFALWSMLIVAGGVVVILYQHASHTGALIALINRAIGDAMTASPNAGSPTPSISTISANPGWSGALSRASGQWTPIGPTRERSAFAYNPPQTFQ